MTGRRLDNYGRIDRSRSIEFVFDSRVYTGFAGDTLASALLANGVMVTGGSIMKGRPRGITSAGPEEPNAVIQVEKPFPEPMLTATTVELRDGLVARSLRGQGKLADDGDPEAYDAIHHHCEVLVVGAGPAGLTAAVTAANTGVRVLLIDDRPTPGGSLLTDDELAWASSMVAQLAALPNVLHLQRTTVAGYYDENFLIAVQHRSDFADAPAVSTRERIWRIRARQVVLATGAHERWVAFAGNDAPGVMLAESVRVYLHRYGVLAGSEVVLFTGHDDAYLTAADLTAAGASVTVVDPRTVTPEGFTVLTGSMVVGTSTDENGVLNGISVRDAEGTVSELPADLLAVSGGWNPAAQLFSHATGNLVYSDVANAYVPGDCRQYVHVAGAVTGSRTTTNAFTEGIIAGGNAAMHPSEPASENWGTISDLPPDEQNLVWLAPFPLYAVMDESVDPLSLDSHYVDLQRDVTIADVVRASGAGLRGVEHVKRYTTAGTAHDQAKTSALLTTAILAAVQGTELDALGVTKYRPPYTAIAFAALAGRERGELYDPVRTTGAHQWHLNHGAEWENVAQWKRPWYYPATLADGSKESMHDAVLRECAATRENVGFMDGSTLGKIDVQGPDAGKFLDMLYTNLMSTLKVGMVRYGVMCNVDGMTLDDGTVFRLADERFLVTTTTGNAAKILEWMEEWLQTEWPDLDVACTSVTEQWATMAVVGPRSRQLIAALTAEDVSQEAMPFMAWRDTQVAGLEARLARISFSGELAFEINVAWHDAAALWDAVWAVGEPIGLTPYGTETMHVLRAEKGFPIIGQDTDGTITPQDLGMGWVVSKKKLDYIGKRSHARPDNGRPDRKHLVGLLPVDPTVWLPEGGQIIETATIPAPPVPMLGHVTSSYHSAALGATFALALVKGGRDRMGETLYIAGGAGMPVGSTIPAVITSAALVDPEGARRDGDPTGEPAPVDGPVPSPGLPVSPLASRAAALQAFSLRPGTGVRLAEVPLTTQLNLRLARGSAVAAAVTAELSVDLPAATGDTSWANGIELVAVGPDEFLVLSGPARAADLEHRIRTAVGAGVAVTDVSASRTIVRISGPKALQLLSHGCALDLGSLKAGDSVQTLLAQCGVVIIVDHVGSADDEPSVRVLVRTSFAGHLADWLLLSGAEY